MDLNIINLYYNILNENKENAAVIDNNKIFSFEQLEIRSNEIAVFLQKQNIKAKDKIAIIMEKGFEYIASILAVMKLGVTYIPLAKCLPEKRIKYILKDSKPKKILIDEHVSLNLKDAVDIKEIKNLPLKNNFISNNTAKDIFAYIIYTSGSTGKPKGVIISHGALSNFASWVKEYFIAYKQFRILNIANFSFDQSVLDYVLLFTLGCPISFCRDISNPFKLLSIIEKNKIQLISTVPSTFNIILSLGKQLEKFNLSNLKVLVLGGAPFPATLKDGLFQFKEDLDIYNIYGPTEVTVYCMIKKISAEDNFNFKTAPIGKEINNMKIYLLDSDENILSGKDVKGELVIVGPQVMEGYFNDKNKTEQAFSINNPDLSSKKLYRTGDTVYRDKKGEYYFLGRNDDQIKSSGYRINLLEIENAISQYKEVKESGVISIPDEKIDNKIIAFISVMNTFNKEELLLNIKKHLPDYMLPHNTVILKQIPKNTSGKIDKVTLKKIYLNGGYKEV